MACKQEKIDDEVWKDIPGYEGMYQISSGGVIKSLTRQDSKGKVWKERIRRVNKGNITLSKDGKQQKFSVAYLLNDLFNNTAHLQSSLLNEEWKPVVGFSEFYQVSNYGRVRSCNRLEDCDGVIRRRRGRLMKPQRDVNHPYYYVGLRRNDGFIHFRLIHRLVAESFIGPCPEGMEVLHGEQGSLINHIDNIRYGTRQENLEERDKSYLKTPNRVRQKMTVNKIKEIRKLMKDGESNKSIAQKYNLHPANVSKIRCRRVWKHVEIEGDPVCMIG